MYSNITQALGESRIREWHEQAARDRLVRQARRARREAASAPARRPRLWAGFKPAEPVSAAPADERAGVAADREPVSAAAADEQAGVAADREPVGSRAA
jgi:hypothetical protein